MDFVWFKKRQQQKKTEKKKKRRKKDQDFYLQEISRETTIKLYFPFWRLVVWALALLLLFWFCPLNYDRKK